MDNKYLERELDKDILEKIQHEIFENVNKKDLDKLKEKIKDLPFKNIIVEFDMEKINNSKLLNMYPYGSSKSLNIWDQFVAIQVLKAFKKEINDEIEYIEKEEDIIYNAGEKEYLESAIITYSNGVKFLFGMMNMLIGIHFIIKENNKALCNAVSSYLDEDSPITMIYCNNNFIYKVKNKDSLKENWLWDIYDYKLFDGFNEGIDSKKIRKEKVTPDKPKQLTKVLNKDEEV